MKKSKVVRMLHYGTLMVAMAPVIFAFQNCSTGFSGKAAISSQFIESTFSLGGNVKLRNLAASMNADGSYSPFVLNAGQAIAISGAQLVMQTDGNLVIYQGSTPLWATSFSASLDGSPTYGRNCASCFASFQSDGNLVLYSGSTAYWDSATYGNPGSHLTLSTNSPYVQITQYGALLWPRNADGSNSFGHFELTAGQQIGIADGTFVMQGDGNLVLYDPKNQPLWASSYSASLDGQPTYGRDCGQCRADFQADGNFVLYGPNGAYWDSATNGHPGASLRVSSSSPYLQIYSGGSAIWPSAPTLATATAPSGSVWVDKADGSLAQFPGGATDLQTAATALTSAGVQIYAQQKSLSPTTAISFPVTSQGLTSSNPNPTAAIASGVQNSFQIAANSLSVAQSQGYHQRSGQVLAAQDCSGSTVLLAFGQSNSANSGWQADTSSVPNLLMFYNGYCFPASDPLLGASIYNNGGSLWMPFAKAFLADHPGQKVVLVSFGVGGSQSADWAQNGMWNARLTTVLNQVRNAGFSISRVFWHQGETDNLNGVSQSQYTANLTSIYNTVRQYTAVPISLAVVSYAGSLPYRVSKAVQTAQLQFVMSHPSDVGIGVVSDLYSIAYRGPDDLHLNGLGLSAVGNAWYQATLSPSAPSYTQQMVNAFCETYLQRIPDDSTSQAGDWLNMPTPSAFSGISGSSEAYIRNQYNSVAHRMADTGGLQYWTSVVATSGSGYMGANFASGVQNVILSGSYDHNLWYLSNGMLFPRTNLWHIDLGLGSWVQN